MVIRLEPYNGSADSSIPALIEMMPIRVHFDDVDVDTLHFSYKERWGERIVDYDVGEDELEAWYEGEIPLVLEPMEHEWDRFPDEVFWGGSDNMNTCKFKNRYGDEYEIFFEKVRYLYGGLAIDVWNKHEYGWEPYGTLTKNLGDFPPTSCAYLDANNLPDLAEFVLGNGWAEVIGEGSSGYCTYPFVQFTDEFLENVCFGEEE